MSLMALPLVMINMGSEMVYVLSQRLQSQEVSTEKITKVVNDIINALLDQNLIQDYIQLQPCKSLKELKTTFHNIAHSSIMKLNENSMDKLFDLMIMGFKYQILSLLQPNNILQVTYTHLEEIKKLCDPKFHHLITETKMTIQQIYVPLCHGEWQNLNQALLLLLQDQKTKISLFLQEKIQNENGSIILMSPKYNPNYINSPLGTIRKFDKEGKIELEYKIALKYLELNDHLFLEHPVDLGKNLFDDNERSERLKKIKNGNFNRQQLRPVEKKIPRNLSLLASILELDKIQLNENVILDVFSEDPKDTRMLMRQISTNRTKYKNELNDIVNDIHQMKVKDEKEDLLTLMDHL